MYSTQIQGNWRWATDGHLRRQRQLRWRMARPSETQLQYVHMVRWAQAHRRMICRWRAWARHTHRGQWGHQDRWLIRWHIYGRIDHQRDTIYTTHLPYNRRHMTNEICTNTLHIIHNTQATWAHSTRVHTTYKPRHTYMLNAYVYTSVSQNMCRVSNERQDQLTLTPYEHQRGW